MDSSSEPDSRLISLICQLMSLDDTDSGSSPKWDEETMMLSVTIHIISLVNSMDLDPPQKPELMSLISQTISTFRSMDMASQPYPLRQLVSLIKQTISLFKSLDLYAEAKPLSKLKSLITQQSSLLDSIYLDWYFRSLSGEKLGLRPKPYKYEHFLSLVGDILRLETEPEIMSIIHQIFLLVIPMNSKWKKLVSLGPRFEVRLEDGKFIVVGKVNRGSSHKWECLPLNWDKLRLTGEREDDTHFFCKGCRGQNHDNFEQALVEVKHPLHPKHSLQLVWLEDKTKTRECYCCEENLEQFFYYCSICDFAINSTCLEKTPVLSIDHPKWHEHTLAYFPRHASMTCDMCALVDSNSPIYICLPCDFLVHQTCMSLPHVIRISRHLHRISFTSSFDQGDWFCGVCRKKIDNDYGGYSCIKEGCSYAAHSKCATQKNVWDGVDLERLPEEVEEDEVEPFVRISDGIIQHFSHRHHHLKIVENASREYDDNKMCQACITPVYFGNFYSCMECDYILHETCANLSRKIYHPIHPHLLTLAGGYDGVMEYHEILCSACPWMCISGFVYECRGCRFKVHVQCATVSEPLDHGSHMHPLFLTSKPEEKRRCRVCENSCKETFNCIEECDFALCFACATLPEKVRYKHDKHILTLSYVEETSTITNWCEACESKIAPQKRFYMCDEYCCVTLHTYCLIGKDIYMKPGSSYYRKGMEVSILPNNHHMSRPFCPYCEKRCSDKIVFHFDGLLFCCNSCSRRDDPY